MGLLDPLIGGRSKYDDVLIPGCKVLLEESNEARQMLECETEKFYRGKKFSVREGETVKIIREIDGKKSRFIPLNEGHVPQPVFEELIAHLKKHFQ